MTGWGIPDWLDAVSYGDIGRWSEYRWRWEFTRRREDCRVDFDRYAIPTLKFAQECKALERRQKPGKKLAGLLSPDQPGFLADVPRCQEKYGLSSLPNPAIGEQPFYAIAFTPPCPRYELWGNSSTNENELKIIFDLKAAIEPQLHSAREILRYKQKQRLGALVQHRKHPTKWFDYLRVLDARESGVSWSDIASSKVLGGMRRKNAQSARDVWTSASGLRSNWGI